MLVFPLLPESCFKLPVNITELLYGIMSNQMVWGVLTHTYNPFEYNDSMTGSFGILHLLLPLISFALESRHFKWNLWY